MEWAEGDRDGRRSAAIALAAVCLLVPVGSAADRSMLAVPLEESPFTESMYVAWRIGTAEGATVSVDVGGTPISANVLVTGTWFWKVGAFERTREWDLEVQSGDTTRVHGHSSLLGGGALSSRIDPLCEVLYHLAMPELPSCFYENDASMMVPETGEWVVLVQIGVDGTFEGKVRLSAPSSTQLLGRTTGTVNLNLEEDFRGDVNVLAEVAGVLGPKVLVNVTSEHVGKAPVFGFFRGVSDLGMLEMELEGPEGRREGSWVYPLGSEVPGLYRFRVNHQVASAWWAHIVVLVGDVEVP